MLPSLIMRFSGGVGRSGGVDDGGFSGELDGGGFADGDCGVVSRFIVFSSNKEVSLTLFIRIRWIFSGFLRSAYRKGTLHTKVKRKVNPSHLPLDASEGAL